MNVRILVTGSRDWNRPDIIHDRLDRAASDLPPGSAITIVTGACPTGADAIAEAYAQDRGWPVERWPADWERHGKAAGPIRNKAMVDSSPYRCLAFIRNGSRGVSQCVRYAIDHGITTTLDEISRWGQP